MSFNPDWKLSPRDRLAVALTLALSKHIPGWPGATDEELAKVADDIISKDPLSGYVAEQVAAERAAWRATMRDIGPTLQRAQAEGILDQIIEANIWPAPPCVISDADVQQFVEMAQSMRPQIEAEKRERAANVSPPVDYGELVERLRSMSTYDYAACWKAADAIASLQGRIRNQAESIEALGGEKQALQVKVGQLEDYIDTLHGRPRRDRAALSQHQGEGETE